MQDPYALILAEARRQVAAGRTPDVGKLADRIRAVAPDDASREAQALQQLERVATVARARSTLARPAPAAAPTPAAPAPRPLRLALRTRPTINANMDVRRETRGDGFALVWDATPLVTGWEVRVSERPDARGDYVVRDTLALPGDATSVELPLGGRTLRVHLLGRARDGRLVRRAVMSGLTREGWDDRWQRRASAS